MWVQTRIKLVICIDYCQYYTLCIALKTQMFLNKFNAKNLINYPLKINNKLFRQTYFTAMVLRWFIQYNRRFHTLNAKHWNVSQVSTSQVNNAKVLLYRE